MSQQALSFRDDGLVAVETASKRGLKEHTVVSLFSGCGGMDAGLVGGFKFLGKRYAKHPFKIVWANDNNPEACKTYEHNLGHPIQCGDIWEQIPNLPKRADVVVGGFPCQDVSINGKRSGLDGLRTSLYRAMVEVVKRTQPKVFVAENVKGLLMRDDREPLKQIIRDFEAIGYDVTWELYLAADYGVPQMRERVFIVGTSKKQRVKKFVHPGATLTEENWITSKEAIGDLERLPLTETFSHIWSVAKKSAEQGNRKLKADQPSATMRAECHGNIQFHYELKRRISMREAARIQSFPDNFIFKSKLRATERQIGNAVPPVLAWHIAKAVRSCLE